MYKYSVLTYNFDGYEILHEIEFIDKDVEYIYVTNDTTITSSTWNVVYERDFEGLSPFEKCYNVRYNPFKYCSTDLCVRIDGSIKVTGDLDIIINEFNSKNYDISVICNNVCSSILVEYLNFFRNRGLSEDEVNSAYSLFGSLGFERDYLGMIEQSLVIQRRDSMIQIIDNLTYNLLKVIGDGNGNIARLDQTVTSFVIEKIIGEDRLNIMYLCRDILFNSNILQWLKHNSNEINYYMVPIGFDYTSWFFNKKVNLYHINNGVLCYGNGK